MHSIYVFIVWQKEVICGACIYDIMRVDTVMSDSSLNVFSLLPASKHGPMI